MRELTPNECSMRTSMKRSSRRRDTYPVRIGMAGTGTEIGGTMVSEPLESREMRGSANCQTRPSAIEVEEEAEAEGGTIGRERPLGFVINERITMRVRIWTPSMTMSSMRPRETGTTNRKGEGRLQ